MNNRKWEEQSMNRLRDFLKHTRREDWRVTGRDVVVDPATGENFDFGLAFGERKMALELFRLVESEPELADHVAWDRFVKLLGEEMEARGLNDYSVEISMVKKTSRQAQAEEARSLAERLEVAVKADAEAKQITLGHVMARKYEGLGYRHFWSVGGFGMFDGEAAAFRILKRMLPKKNAQLSMPGREGVLLVVHWLGLVSAKDFTGARARVDFRQFPNVERIYFEEGLGTISLIFDRAAV